MKKLVIIPTFNERQNIEQLIRAIFEQDVAELHILVIDDNSPDGTGDIVDAIRRDEPRLNLIGRASKQGLGTAYIEGFKYALKNHYDLIFEMDADFSHDPKELPNFIRASGEYDLVIGSRYVRGVNVINWPLSRLLLSMGASIYTRLITGLKLKDQTSGFKCFHRRVLEQIDLDAVQSDGYAFQIEMNFKAWKKGFRIGEIPIIFIDRFAGTSKMSRRIIREAIWMVWKLKLTHLVRKLK